MADYSDVYIVIPAKNEALRIEKVLKKIQKQKLPHVIVVDDASTDNTIAISRRYTHHIVKHRINLGAGGATRTGIEFALLQGAKIIVTIDADDQHDAGEIKAMVDMLRDENHDLVVGSRFIEEPEGVPAQRIFYNRIGNVISSFVTGIRVSDSQSGFRAMTAEFAQNNPIEWNGFEFCIEMLKKAAEGNYSVGEIPITVKYTPETLKKGQSIWMGFRMLARMLMGSVYKS